MPDTARLKWSIWWLSSIFRRIFKFLYEFLRVFGPEILGTRCEIFSLRGLLLNFLDPSQLPLKLARCVQIETLPPTLPIELFDQNKSHPPAATHPCLPLTAMRQRNYLQIKQL